MSEKVKIWFVETPSAGETLLGRQVCEYAPRSLAAFDCERVSSVGECVFEKGRVDIVMIPTRDGEPSMIFALKVADTENALDSEAGDAIAQIHERKYYLGMTGRIMLYGMSFWGKAPCIMLETLDL